MRINKAALPGSFKERSGKGRMAGLQSSLDIEDGGKVRHGVIPLQVAGEHLVNAVEQRGVCSFQSKGGFFGMRRPSHSVGKLEAELTVDYYVLGRRSVYRRFSSFGEAPRPEQARLAVQGVRLHSRWLRTLKGVKVFGC